MRRDGKKKRVRVHIKAGDEVFIRSGADRQNRLTPEEADRLDPGEQKREANRRSGRRGRVMRVLTDENRVIVEGVNMRTKHARPRGRQSQAQQIQSGRIEQPGAVSIANVMLVCPNCDRPTRVRRGHVEGKPVRICRRCNEPVDGVR